MNWVYAPLTYDFWSWRSPVTEGKYSTCQCYAKHQFWNYQVISNLWGYCCGFQKICSVVLKEIENVRLVSPRFGLLSNGCCVSFIGCPFVCIEWKYSVCVWNLCSPSLILISLDNFMPSLGLHFPRIVTLFL